MTSTNPFTGQQAPCGRIVDGETYQDRGRRDDGHRGSGLRVRLPNHPPRVPRRQREPEGRPPRRTVWWMRSVRRIAATVHGPEPPPVTRHDVLLVGGGGGGVCAPPSRSPRRIRDSASPWSRRSIRCEATPSPPKAAPPASRGRTTASTSTPTTRSRAATGCPIRTPSRRSSRKRRRSCCGSSTGDVRGAASPTDASPCARSAG